MYKRQRLEDGKNAHKPVIIFEAEVKPTLKPINGETLDIIDKKKRVENQLKNKIADSEVKIEDEIKEEFIKTNKEVKVEVKTELFPDVSNDYLDFHNKDLNREEGECSDEEEEATCSSSSVQDSFNMVKPIQKTEAEPRKASSSRILIRVRRLYMDGAEPWVNSGRSCVRFFNHLDEADM